MKAHGLIEDEWIVSYAAGALSQAHALIVASHVAYHPELQKTVLAAEELGGLMMAAGDTADIAEDSFDSVLARLDDVPPENEPAATITNNNNLPAPLASYLGKDLDALKWRTMGPGMSQVRLSTRANNEKLWLLRARGGTKIPAHDHRGNEFTLVLQGSYHVGDKHYTPGMLELTDDSHINHQPMIDEGEDCICLVVTEAPIKLHSLMGRLCQPFIGL